jgi:hypothetical protein
MTTKTTDIRNEYIARIDKVIAMFPQLEQAGYTPRRLENVCAKFLDSALTDYNRKQDELHQEYIAHKR